MPVQDDASEDYQNDEDYNDYAEDDEPQQENPKNSNGVDNPVFFSETEIFKTVHEGQHAVLPCEVKNINRKLGVIRASFKLLGGLIRIFFQTFNSVSRDYVVQGKECHHSRQRCSS